MRIAIPAAALLAGALGLGLYLDLLGDEPPSASSAGSSWIDMDAVRQKGQELDEVREGLCRFQKEFARLQQAVLAGSFPLTDAADEVAEAARRHNPGFLKGLESVRAEPTERERVVRCLLRHFDVRKRAGQLTPDQLALLDRLQSEYGPDPERY